MDWSVSTSSKNDVQVSNLLSLCIREGELLQSIKCLQKNGPEISLPYENSFQNKSEYSDTNHCTDTKICRYKSIFFLKSPVFPMICPYIWKNLNSRITGVSTLCSLFHFQPYFSVPILVHFTHKYFFQVGWTPSFHIKFSVSKNKLGIMQDMPCFWRMSQQKCFF